MAIIPARLVLAYITEESTVKVNDQDGHFSYDADYRQIVALAEAGQIWASLKGSRLRFVQLMVPLSEVAKPHTGKERSASGAIAQDCRTIMRGHDLLALDYVHNNRICQTYGSPARQKVHQAAAAESRLARAKARNRPVAQTFTQRASLSDRLALSS